jgi:hypothetical protein
LLIVAVSDRSAGVYCVHVRLALWLVQSVASSIVSHTRLSRVRSTHFQLWRVPGVEPRRLGLFCGGTDPCFVWVPATLPACVKDVLLCIGPVFVDASPHCAHPQAHHLLVCSQFTTLCCITPQRCRIAVGGKSWCGAMLFLVKYIKYWCWSCKACAMRHTGAMRGYQKPACSVDCQLLWIVNALMPDEGKYLSRCLWDVEAACASA